MFVFNSDHVLTYRLITRGVGKQTNHPCRFDIDYNIIMSDYLMCVCVFGESTTICSTRQHRAHIVCAKNNSILTCHKSVPIRNSHNV